MAEKRERTKVVPYAMLCTAHEVCLAMSQSRGTRVIHEWIIGQRSKLSLVTSGLRNFLGYGGDKEFDVKSYIDASLTRIRIALSRDTGYI